MMLYFSLYVVGTVFAFSHVLYICTCFSDDVVNMEGNQIMESTYVYEHCLDVFSLFVFFNGMLDIITGYESK